MSSIWIPEEFVQMLDSPDFAMLNCCYMYEVMDEGGCIDFQNLVL